MEKARKAYFKMKKIIGLDNPCKLLETLFDSIITPILLYCCEIWGIYTNIGENYSVSNHCGLPVIKVHKIHLYLITSLQLHENHA